MTTHSGKFALRRFFVAMAFAPLAFATPVAAETIAFTGGTVVIGEGEAPIENGTVVVRDGKVVSAGANVTVPAGTREVDASGQWITPGIFAGFSRVGLTEVSAVSQTNDESASGSMFSAALDVAPAIDPFRTPIAVSRAAGVTRAVVAPDTGSTIFAGRGAIIDLGEDYNPITVPHAFQFAEMGERGAFRAGGSRTASHILIRAMFREARDYAAGRSGFDDEMLTAEDAAALQAVLDGREKLLVHVEGANDIVKVLDLAREYPKIDLVLVGASEGWRVADRIAAAGVPVIASALNDLPSAFESLAATQSNIGRMKRAGVKVAIGMIDDNDAHQIRYSPQYAGNLVALQSVPGASGLSWGEAFAAISSVPADIAGVGDRLGALKPGYIADIVLWDGDPLQLSSAPVMVMIDGTVQSLDNRQADLRDRYRTPDEGELPKAYER